MKSFPKVIECMGDLGLGNKFLNLQACILCTTSCLIVHSGKGKKKAAWDYSKLDSGNVVAPYRSLEEFET